MSTRLSGRLKRKQRIRGKISGTAEKPRLTIYRSHKHLYAQLIDDSEGKTLVSASTLEKGHKQPGSNKNNAVALGKRLAEKAKAVDFSPELGVERRPADVHDLLERVKSVGQPDIDVDDDGPSTYSAEGTFAHWYGVIA